MDYGRNWTLRWLSCNCSTEPPGGANPPTRWQALATSCGNQRQPTDPGSRDQGDLQTSNLTAYTSSFPCPMHLVEITKVSLCQGMVPQRGGPSSFLLPTYKEPFSLGPPSSAGQVRMRRNNLSASSEAVPISCVTSNISFSRVSLPFNIKSSSGTGVCGTQVFF